MLTAVVTVLCVIGTATLGVGSVGLIAWMLGRLRAEPVVDQHNQHDAWEELTEEERAYLKRWTRN